MELFDGKGEPYYMHTITDEQKDALTEEEKAFLLPAVDAYDNKLIMPLKVRTQATYVHLLAGCGPRTVLQLVVRLLKLVLFVCARMS